MGDGDFIIKGPQTCTLSKEQAVTSIMLWLHRAVSLVTHVRELLPKKCFEQVPPEIEVSDLLQKSFHEPKDVLPASFQSGLPLIAPGISSRADLLLTTLENTVWPAVRSQTVITFHLLIVQVTAAKQNDILEDYAFTMCHNGHSFLELGLKDAPKNKKKIVIGDVIKNLKRSLTDLNKTLHSLGALPDVRHMMIRMACPPNTPPVAFQGFIAVGSEAPEMAIRPGWIRKSDVQDTIAFGRRDYKGVGLKMDCLRRQQSLHEAVQEDETEPVSGRDSSAAHSLGGRISTSLSPPSAHIQECVTTSPNVTASAKLACALTQNSTLSATDILRVQDLRQIGQNMEEIVHEDSLGDTQIRPSGVGMLEMIEHTPIPPKSNSPPSCALSMPSNRNQGGTKRKSSYLCQDTESEHLISDTARRAKQRRLRSGSSGTPDFMNYEMEAIMNVSKDWQTPQFGHSR